MCVICFKPVGVRLPPTWALEESNRNNPHGAGFAVAEPDRARIIIKKGFRSALALEEALVKTIREMGRTQLGVQAVIHFRWATRGTKSGGNCHPFPSRGSIASSRRRRSSARRRSSTTGRSRSPCRLLWTISPTRSMSSRNIFQSIPSVDCSRPGRS